MRSAALIACAGFSVFTFSAQGEEANPDQTRLIKNSFCNISTYVHSKVPGQVRAVIKDDGKPAIYLDERLLARKELSRFLLAHECCHHTLGHVDLVSKLASQSKPPVGPKWNHNIELDADCCAARLLANNNDRPALENAKQFMFRYGPKPTGFGYPSGFQRGMVIRHCALTKSNDAATIYLNETEPKK